LSFAATVWNDLVMPSDWILREVVSRAIEGDDTALVEFVALTESDVWKLCHVLGSDGDVEDLVQETYLRAIRSMRSFRGDARVLAWLLRIGRNVCADHVRLRQRDRGLVERLAPRIRDAEWVEPSFASDLLAGLARPQLEAFVLTQLLDMTYETAAEVLDCPVGTVRSRLFRARQELARRHDRSAITG
jgi:RNA polymerase sigma-70 factor (ECF subfamily)